MNRLVRSPSRQAADTVEELLNREENDGKLRMALFELQKFIRVTTIDGFSSEYALIICTSGGPVCSRIS
jgi:hypothetical protein